MIYHTVIKYSSNKSVSDDDLVAIINQPCRERECKEKFDHFQNKGKKYIEDMHDEVYGRQKKKRKTLQSMKITMRLK